MNLLKRHFENLTSMTHRIISLYVICCVTSLNKSSVCMYNYLKQTQLVVSGVSLTLFNDATELRFYFLVECLSNVAKECRLCVYVS